MISQDRVNQTNSPALLKKREVPEIQGHHHNSGMRRAPEWPPILESLLVLGDTGLLVRFTNRVSSDQECQLRLPDCKE